MCYIDHENNEPSVVYIAQNSVVTDPITPHTRQVSCQSLTPAPWIFELRHLFKLIKHSRRNTLVELSHRLIGVLRELNSPGHSAPSPH